MQPENDFIPYHSNIKKDQDLPTTLIVSDTPYEIINCTNAEKYTQLMIYNISSGGMVDIDLSKFINLRVLYVHNAHANITFPESLTGLLFSQCYAGISFPYKESVKYVFSRGSMSDLFIDFSEAYHKYKLHNFNYNSVVSKVNQKIAESADHSFDMSTLDSIIKDNLA
jgi:hypothetical protein